MLVTVAVLGQGSIGQRHARLLRAQGHEVRAVSAHAPGAFRRVEDALADGTVTHAVVATPTTSHATSLAQLSGAGFAGSVLVEKPLLDQTGEGFDPGAFRSVKVAYNLRFHPALAGLRERLQDQRAASANAVAVSWLPDWRPGRPLGETSSAARRQGGGVLRDLSHELDSLRWLFGPLEATAAAGGTLGTLPLDVEDCVGLLLRAPACPLVIVHLSYLDRRPERRIRVVTSEETVEADLAGWALTSEDGRVEYTADWDQTYRDQLRAFLDGDPDVLCDAEEGLETVALIERCQALMGSGA